MITVLEDLTSTCKERDPLDDAKEEPLLEYPSS